MEEQDKDPKGIPRHQPTCVGRLLSHLMRDRRTLVELFSVPGATAVFEAFYEHEVNLHGRTYIENPALKKCLTEVGMWLENPNKTVGLLMAGNPGNGKSTALATIKTLISCSEQKDPENTDYYGHPSDACLTVYKAIDILHFTNDEYKFNQLKRTGLLAIDDFGLEPVEVQKYGNVYSPIIELLEYRYDNRLFTVLTTNLLIKTIRERYGDRMADRFNEMLTCVAFPDVSFRSIRDDSSP